MTRSADLLADDSVNGFTRLFIASKKDDIGRGVHKIQSHSPKDVLEKILKMGQT